VDGSDRADNFPDTGGGVVLADQLKSLDWRARKAKLIERASSDVLAMVTARILPLLVPDNAATL
jgi:mRNA-degrading endonuclease toxin of MazEF toxin-antitoxin module